MKRLRPSSLNKERMSRLQTVPWFSKKEWLETYHQVYSKEKELQAKAYTKMCIWKARYPNLPLGVECTMSMLHVKLCDQPSDITNTMFKDGDLQLLYSTAVMRFLNHLTLMSNCKDSMYKVAEQHKIPDWLINLRHEAAHGNSVPALYLLRQAGDVILHWLREHYWEAEAEIMTDVIKDQANAKENHNKETIELLLELWLVLKMSYWSGYKTVDNIPNDQFRSIAMDLARGEGFSAKHTSVKETRSFGESVAQTALEDGSVIVNSVNTEPPTLKIKTVFNPLLTRLFAPLNGKKHEKCLYGTSLITCLLNYKGFCPQLDISKIGESGVQQLMSLLGDLWKEVLEGLQYHRLLHHLMRALMKHENKLTVADLWLRLLTHLLSGEHPPQPPGTELVCRMLATSLPFPINPKILLQKANLHHVNHQRLIVLKPPSAQEVEVLQDLGQRVLENPTPFSLTYLNRLLRFWETPLSVETVDNLCVLAQLYSGEQHSKSRSDNVYTVASLLERGLVIGQSDDNMSASDGAPHDITPWQVYTGDADWSKCALGALPWKT